MSKRLLYGVVLTVLAANLFLGARIYSFSAEAGQKDDEYANYRLFADVLEKVRQESVEGGRLTYQDLIHSALKGMLSSLDPHSEFMEASKFEEMKKDTQGEFGGVGIVINLNKDKQLTVVSPMEDSPAFRAGIMAGDRIVKIEGRSTERFTTEDAVKRLRGQSGTEVTVTTLRPSTGETRDVKLKRSEIKVPTVKDLNNKQEFPLGENGIGYIHLTQFGEQTSADLEKGLKKLEGQGMRALILDLRGNPGGLLDQAGQVAEKWLPRGTLVVTTEGRGATQKSEYRSSGRNKHPNMPMVVLVNGGSASAAEIVSGCLQDLQPITKAIVIGEQTFGKGSVQSVIPLTDGSALRLTTARYFTPSHKVIHERGITPDIVVTMTDEEERDNFLKKVPGGIESLDEKDRERIRNAVDPQLERALDVLKGVLLYTKRANEAASKMASK
ncbi:MAG: S41 family peptidase [Opitutaceae bacterium]|nr:S41 family peptidase [Verrucomicrobiales bacterium]